jgi:hypothetical protein
VVLSLAEKPPIIPAWCQCEKGEEER